MTAVALLVVGLIGWWTLGKWRDSSTAVDIDGAVEEFRDLYDDDFTGAAGLPAPGVYRYTTIGGEGIDVLTKPRHDYPSESAIVISPSGCGVRVEWMPLEERNEWWEMCPVDGGIAIETYGGVHEFFGNRDQRTLTCDSRHWLVPPPQGEVIARFRCTGTNLVHEWSREVVGRVSVVVGGEVVEAVDIRSEIITKGDATGTTIRELVVAANGLPLSWTERTTGRSDSPLGTVNHDEEFVLELRGLSPVR